VLALSQRHRYFKYVGLPLVLAIVWLIAAQLIALQRADIIAVLADRVAHSDSPEAAAAVRQLAAMPGAPVAILVKACASADAKVAAEGKLHLGRLLRRAQRRIEAGRGVGGAARQLADLAAALDAHKNYFSSSDDAWLSSTARKVVRLANGIPPRHAPLVATHCDAVLAVIAAREAAAVAKIADGEPDLAAAAAGEGAAHEVVAPAVQARMGGEPTITVERPPGEHELAPIVPAETVQARSAAANRAEAVAPSVPTALPQAVSAAPQRAIEPQPGAQMAQRASEVSGSNVPATEPDQIPWQASWAHPIFRIMPAASETAPPDELVPTDISSPQDDSSEEQSDETPLAALGGRALLARWLAAGEEGRIALAGELSRRGFDPLPQLFVEQLLSEAVEDRLALGTAVLREPGIDARPWLTVLAEDPDAEVRLLAVTIMATSNDAALVEKAWQISLRDRDPRIARLAGRLRERRDQSR
jgi:hypothetical protein